MSEFILKEDEIYKLFEPLDSLIGSGVNIFILSGDLASGKTTLIRSYIAHCLPEKREDITSPTFSLLQSYGDLHHYDFYHHDIQKFLELGLLEGLSSGIHFIEWGEKLESILKNSGYNYAVISITTLGDKRKYRISGL